MKTYKELLTMGKEALDSLRAGSKANEMQAKAALELAQLETKLLELARTIEDETAKYPIDFDKILSAQDKYQLTERRIEKFKALVAELFPV